MTLLNIAEICSATRTLGPGQRFAIWVQGCCFNCKGCVSPEWIPQTQATLIEPKKLAEMILSVPGTEGVTVSGGEPMLQAIALRELFIYLRQGRQISIICFTGFSLQQLQSQSDRAIDDILTLVDVLIDGQYIEQLNDNKGWRGPLIRWFIFSHPVIYRKRVCFWKGNGMWKFICGMIRH